MNARKQQLFGCLVLSLVAAVGCNKSTSKTQPVEAARVPEVIQEAFHDANPALQSQVSAVEDASKRQDPTALTPLLDLMHRPDLTPEQRAAANRCLPALLGSARQAADKGDERAAEALKAYHVSK